MWLGFTPEARDTQAAGRGGGGHGAWTSAVHLLVHLGLESGLLLGILVGQLRDLSLKNVALLEGIV